MASCDGRRGGDVENAFVRLVRASIPTPALGGAVALTSSPPHHDIVVAASALDGLAAGDVVVAVSGRAVPRRLTAKQLADGVARRAADAGDGAPPRSPPLRRGTARRRLRALRRARRAPRPPARARRARAACGGADAAGLPVVAGAAGAAGLRRGGVVAVDGAPVAPGAGAVDLGAAGSVLAARSSTSSRSRTSRRARTRVEIFNPTSTRA
ncbi:hypothetical protein JL720_7206 [Aureococcus anophagefferens]|nr:hypothetical protein JL720_7206 [Aureococcus anophagefferens]